MQSLNWIHTIHKLKTLTQWMNDRRWYVVFAQCTSFFFSIILFTTVTVVRLTVWAKVYKGNLLKASTMGRQFETVSHMAYGNNIWQNHHQSPSVIFVKGFPYVSCDYDCMSMTVRKGADRCLTKDHCTHCHLTGLRVELYCNFDTCMTPDRHISISSTTLTAGTFTHRPISTL